jgi:hypothetical protein
MNESLRGKIVTATQFVSSVCVGTVVSNIVLATTPPQINIAGKIIVEIGKMMLSGTAAWATADYIEKELIPPATAEASEEPSEPKE